MTAWVKGMLELWTRVMRRMRPAFGKAYYNGNVRIVVKAADSGHWVTLAKSSAISSQPPL